MATHLLAEDTEYLTADHNLSKCGSLLNQAIAQEEGTTVELDNDAENDNQDEMGGFELSGFEPDNDFAQDGRVFFLILFFQL